MTAHHTRFMKCEKYKIIYDDGFIVAEEKPLKEANKDS